MIKSTIWALLLFLIVVLITGAHGIGWGILTVTLTILTAVIIDRMSIKEGE